MEQARGGNDSYRSGSARTGTSSTARQGHNTTSPGVLLPASLNPDSVGTHAHYLYRAAPENAERGAIRIEDMFLYEKLAEDTRKVAVSDLISKCKNVLEMFQEWQNYQSRHATKDNYHSDALPITNIVVSKLSQAVTNLEEVSRITSSQVLLDPQTNRLYFIK